MVKLVKELPQEQREWRNMPEVYNTCRQNQLISVTDQLKWEQKIESDPSIEMFGISAGKKLVGTCGLTGISFLHRTAEYSMLVGPPHQGYGYATEALKVLFDYGFQNLGLHCIWGEIFSNNQAGVHIAQKLGMQREGRLRERYFKQGEWVDTVTYSILADEWRKHDHRGMDRAGHYPIDLGVTDILAG